jgi:hypothetical protein
MRTTGPGEGNADTFNVGVAAHINAASPGGPRYDPQQSREERRSHENAIWMCQNHAKSVDADPEKYPANLLHQWKRTHEDRVRQSIGRRGIGPFAVESNQGESGSWFPTFSFERNGDLQVSELSAEGHYSIWGWWEIEAKALEGAIAGVIRSSRELYAFTGETLMDVSGLPIKSQLGAEPAIADHVVRGVYRAVSARMHGNGSPVLKLSEIESGAGGAMEFWALHPALIAPPHLSKQKIVTCLTETVQRVTNNDLAVDLARNEKRADDLGAKLRAYANDLRLLRYLPGTCRICRRYEVR